MEHPIENRHAGLPWHQWTSEEVAQRLTVTPSQGLSDSEALSRSRHYGPNSIRETRSRSPLGMFISQFTDFMIVVLMAAAVVSGLAGDIADTVTILAIIVLNAIIGFAQEYRAERAVAALKKMAALSAHVVREGAPKMIPASALVPGDVVLVEAGQSVPADARLVEVAQLKVDESALTGESQPVEKDPRAIAEAEIALGDRRNLAFKGTMVTYGRARAIVVATGMETQLGHIAELLHTAEDSKTPLQKRLTRLGRTLAIAVLVICALLFVTGVLRGEPALLMLLTAISLAVAAIPEALPAVVSVSLALGARTMARHQALIRKLPAVETLGSVTYVCSDKTGTLTQNRMRVDTYYAAGESVQDLANCLASEEPWRTLIQAMALSNDAHYDAEGVAIGDPTEVALLEAAAGGGVDKRTLAQTQGRVAEIPFDSQRARMTTVHREGAGAIAFTKGAPERLLPLCVDVLHADGVHPLDVKQIEGEAERMATEGLRVLAVAMRRFPEAPAQSDGDAIETSLTLVGLVGLIDPPRSEAFDAVRLCRTAGIHPVMITGDHPATALAVARRLGIVDHNGEVLTGADLARMDLPTLRARVRDVRVYARVAPEQKINIVRALQECGEFVAMTGDGVNDAPALRRADIGVAMGVTGTDVAKEAGHMILLDDNFATIVAAVREGRRIFDNIRKFVKYTMTSNSGEIWTIFLAPFLGLPIPLLPIHILWINLVTDGLPGLALAAEPAEKGVMERPPRPPNESIFAHGMWQHILWVGLLMGAVCLLTEAIARELGNANWQTMVFTVLTLSQLGHVLAIRSERRSLFRQGLLSNRPLAGALALTVMLQMATIYVPWLNPIFKTTPLSLAELLCCFALSSIVFFAVELEKWAICRGWLYNEAADAAGESRSRG